MIKLIRSTFTAIALGLLFSIPYAAPIDAAAKFDDSINLTTIPKLPACTANNSGSSAAVSDYAGSIAWGAAVGTGGGTRVARVYCDGGSWTVFAGGGGGSTPSTQQNLVLAAPITPNATNSSNLNYNNGCLSSPGAASGNFANHSCLMFDDHWTTTPTSTTKMTSLNTSNWYPGYFRCNGGTGGNAQCVQQIAWVSGDPPYPWSGWCFDLPTGGCTRQLYYDWGNGLTANPQPTGITNPTMAIAADGSLDLETSYYTSGTIESAANCTSFSEPPGPSADCAVLNWINASLTSGSLPILADGPNTQNLPNNLTALLPANGGIFQVRIKFDNGVGQGMWSGMECDAVDSANGVNGAGTNSNIEFGYSNHGLTSPFQGFAQGMDNHPYSSGNPVVTTGDDGIGIGDLRNWHTFAIEWTGNATHQWNWYIDGHPLASGGTTGHNEANGLPNQGYTCAIYPMMTNNGEFDPANPTATSSFATGWTAGTGPFHMYVSDAQIYKKPGT